MTPSIQALARALVAARWERHALDVFPGTVPDTLDGAYAVQLAAIALWPDEISGWKVGRLSDDLADRYGIDRFIGPVFRDGVTQAVDVGGSRFRMFAGGSAAFEAEYVAFATVGSDGVAMVSDVTTGIEVASSPIAALPLLGSLASVADLGNNAGQIIGAPVPVERFADAERLRCETRIGAGLPVVRTAASLPGGPAAAFAFAVEQAGRLGLPLKSGQFVSTGAVTGMHAVAVGQTCSADFGAYGRIDCTITGREADREGMT